MKNTTLIFRIAFCTIVSMGWITSASAQRSYIRSQIRQNIERDVAEKQRERGREEIRKVSYENDTRYDDFYNETPVTIGMESTEFNVKNGEAKNKTVSKLVFGKKGECIIMNEGTREEMRIIYNYVDKANYMVNVKEKTATKMPLINIQKFAERAARRHAENPKAEDQGTWKATNETKTINGYSCQKYVYTYPEKSKYASYDVWVSKQIPFKLKGNYLLGAQLDSYSFPEQTINADYPKGLIVRSVFYDKKTGKASNQMDLKEFKNSADDSYFDLSNYKVMDILDGL